MRQSYLKGKMMNELFATVMQLSHRIDELEKQTDRQGREIRVLQKLAHRYEEEIDTLNGDVAILLRD